jgi:hypothetical protein
MDDFERNYNAILRLLKRNNIRVITCGMVKNIKDFKPLKSKGNIMSTEIEQIIEIIKIEKDSIKKVQQLNERINDNAALSYVVADSLLELGENRLAKYFYYKACDLDMLRLRASSDINKIIERLSQAHNCSYIDLQEFINDMDEDGIAGDDLILEHVHPSLDCHTAIAKKLAATIFTKIFKGKAPENYQKIEIQASLIEKIAVAKILHNTFSKYPFDRYKYFNKKGFEPIYNTNYEHFSQFTLKENIDKNAYRILDQYFNKYRKIDEIHIKYGAYLHKSGKYEKAYYEFMLAYRQNPMNIVALNNMAVMRFISGDETNGLKMQQGVFELAPSYGIGVMNLWYMYMATDQLEKAKEYEFQLKKLKIEKKYINSLTFDDV